MKHQSTIAINIARFLDELAKFSATDKGVTRLPYTKESKAAVAYIKEEMNKLELIVQEDAVGTVYGKLEGSNKEAGSILVGSHYDTVTQGGRYDGALGIAIGLELIRLLKEMKYQPYHNIEIVATNDEEGVRFGTGFFSTKAMLGEIAIDEIKTIVDKDGISVYKAMKESGYQPENINEAQRDINKIKAFYEVHIEQGPVLDSKTMDLGVVTGIVGMKRWIVTVQGEANHAGTTPMDMRKDAIQAACQIIADVSHLAKEQPIKTVATVGYITVKPNAINIIAKEVSFGIDVRSMSTVCIQQVLHGIEDKINAVKETCGITYLIRETLSEEPVELDEQLIHLAKEKCEQLGYQYIDMASGAGHDALAMAPYVKTGMLFVPSKDGISHQCGECSGIKQIEKAVLVTKEIIMNADCILKTTV